MPLSLGQLEQLVREQLMPPGYCVSGPAGNLRVVLPDDGVLINHGQLIGIALPGEHGDAARFAHVSYARVAAWGHFDATESP